MKFGLLYLTDYHPEAHGTYTTYYERMLDQIITAEALGFDGGGTESVVCSTVSPCTLEAKSSSRRS